jgi:choline-sulfatase
MSSAFTFIPFAAQKKILYRKITMNRRTFLEKTAAYTAATAATIQFGYPSIISARTKDQRPNILFINTDQQFGQAMSCTGNTWVSTPNMDSIAAHGMRFTQSYCAWPVCVPQRAAWFTGRRLFEIGTVTGEDTDIPSDIPLLGRLIKDAGYDTGYTGKWHIEKIEPIDTARHGFDFCNVPQPKDTDKFIASDCDTFLKQKRDKPFFLVASIMDPHDICAIAAGNTIPGPDGPLPAPPSPEKCPPIENFSINDEPKAIDLFRQYIGGPSLKWDLNKWRQYKWSYYRLIERADRIIGSILKSLRESGQADNTVIIFSSDHGEGMGSHQLPSKATGYEESLLVPFIISGKNFAKSNSVNSTHLVNNGLDLFPTICDYAGISIPQSCDGKSVRALAEGVAVKNWRDHLVSEQFIHWVFHAKRNQGVYTRTYIDSTYKYICMNDFPEGHPLRGKDLLREQLFHRKNDPGEMTNLAADQSQKSLLYSYRKKMHDWCVENNDSWLEVPSIPISVNNTGKQGSPEIRCTPRLLSRRSLAITIESQSTADALFRILDLSGKTVFNRSLRLRAGRKELTIQTGLLAPGVFQWRLETKRGNLHGTIGVQ